MSNLTRDELKQVIREAIEEAFTPLVHALRTQEQAPITQGPSIRANELPHYFGSARLAEEIVKAGWLKPVLNRKKCVIYDRSDCAKAWERLRKGDEPQRFRR